MKLRYDSHNVLCLCAGCHWYAHKNPLDFMGWFASVYKDKFDYLQKHKNDICKFTLQDYIDLVEYLKKQYGRNN